MAATPESMNGSKDFAGLGLGPHKFDLVVVGSGAGLSLIEEGVGRGLKCALVESGKIGGTCLNRGCIPSKILTVPADAIREAEHARKIGVDLRLGGVDWELIALRMWDKIGENEDMERALAGAPGLTVYRGTGEFTGDMRMRVRLRDGSFSEEFTAARFVLATGARSFVPPIEGLAEAGFVTSESFFGEKFPAAPWKSLVIVGGGVIAAEFAHIFSAFGTKVTIVEMEPRLLPGEEPEVSSFVAREFARTMDVRLGARAISARVGESSAGGSGSGTGSGAGGGARDVNDSGGNGGPVKIVAYEDVKTGAKSEVSGDEILVAVGRYSNADLIHLEKTGVKTDARGWIVVNEYLETSRPGIWAIGDAIGGYQFRHKANYDSDICVHNALEEGHPKVPVDYSVVPWAIYTHPQVGHVGMTERQALEKGYEIYTGIHRYSDVARGYALGYELGDPDDGFVKLVVDKSYRILGAHVVGPHASTLVQPFVYLMNAGFECVPPEKRGETVIPKELRVCPAAGSIMPIYRSMIIHPSLSEVAAWAIRTLEPVNIKRAS
jgi:mycothione reductase